MATENTLVEKVAAASEPRLYLHKDRKHLSIGFEDSNDTLLGMPKGARDIERVEQWCALVQDRLKRAERL